MYTVLLKMWYAIIWSGVVILQPLQHITVL